MEGVGKGRKPGRIAPRLPLYTLVNYVFDRNPLGGKLNGFFV